MKPHFATFCLFLLLVAVGASAASGSAVIFNDGAISGHYFALPINGPNNVDISNGFTAAASATPNTLQFGLWIGHGITPTTVSYEIGTSAFGTDLGSGTVALNGSNSNFLFTLYTNDVYSVTIPVTSLAVTAADTYWLSLSNANDALNSGTEAWDVPSFDGGPAICFYRMNGVVGSNCGGDTYVGGESWVLSSGTRSTPEPGSLILLGSSVIAVVGVLRRRLTM